MSNYRRLARLTGRKVAAWLRERKIQFMTARGLPFTTLDAINRAL